MGLKTEMLAKTSARPESLDRLILRPRPFLPESVLSPTRCCRMFRSHWHPTLTDSTQSTFPLALSLFLSHRLGDGDMVPILLHFPMPE